MDMDALLSEVKNQLNITWDDPGTDQKLIRIIQNGIFYLNDKAGEELDYSSPGYGQELLFEYARYAWNEASDVFENNCRSKILSMQHNCMIERRTHETEPVPAD